MLRRNYFSFFFCLSIVYFLLSTVYCSAQSNDTLKQYRSYHFNYDNDFFNATDRYYTQGIRWEFNFPFVKKIPISKLLFRLHHSNDEQFGFTLNQDCYTPASIRHSTIYYGERPFAAAMYLGFSRISNDEEDQERMSSEIDIGGLGPCAVCEQEQKAIHKGLNNIQPLGWEFQIANDIVLNYSFKYERNVLAVKNFDLIASADAKLGTLYDRVGGELKMRMGKMKNYFSMPGFSKHFYFYVFTGQGFYAVVYNASMEGGMFQKNNIYVIDPKNIERMVARGSVGAVLTYKKLSLEYSKTFISEEFKTGQDHAWGHVNITVYF